MMKDGSEPVEKLFPFTSKELRVNGRYTINSDNVTVQFVERSTAELFKDEVRTLSRGDIVDVEALVESSFDLKNAETGGYVITVNDGRNNFFLDQSQAGDLVETTAEETAEETEV